MDPQTAQQPPQAPASTPPAEPVTPPMTTVEATAPIPPQQPSPFAPPAAPTPPVGNAPVQDNPAPSQAETKKSSSKMWVIMIVFIVLILAVAGWFLYQYSMNKPNSIYGDKMTTPTTVPSPTLGAVESGDKQLDQQSTTIDDSMNKLEDDIKGIDSGLNDKPENLNP